MLSLLIKGINIKSIFYSNKLVINSSDLGFFLLFNNKGKKGKGRICGVI